MDHANKLSEWDDLLPVQQSLLTKAFDVEFYRKPADSSIDDRELIVRYLESGWKEGREPTASFSASRYLRAHPALHGTDENPFLHYLFDEVGEVAAGKAFNGLTLSDIARLRMKFDSGWYLHRYPIIATSGADAFVDYMTSGWIEGRDPSPDFSTSFYLHTYPDIAESGINPFFHWVMHGIAEGRSATPNPAGRPDAPGELSSTHHAIVMNVFDAEYYASRYADPAVDSAIALADYLQNGWRQGREPTASFCGARYIESHPALLATGQNPFLHYVFENVGEDAIQRAFAGLTTSDVARLRAKFDPDWYLYCYPNIEASGVDAFLDYMTSGWLERRDPSPDFSTNLYLHRYPDIAMCGINPFLHWVIHGIAEGRSGTPALQRFRSRSYNPTVVAVIAVAQADISLSASIASIVNQHYDNLKSIIVSYVSDVHTQTLIKACIDQYPMVNFLCIGHDNGIGLTEIWRAGVSATQSDLIWFSRGRSVYKEDFLKRAVSSFADGSVQIGFGRFVDHASDQVSDRPPGDLQSRAGSKGWDRHIVNPAADWFARDFSTNVLVSDPHDWIWRRTDIAEAIWTEAAVYEHIGHWYLYVHMLAGGQIAWIRDALGHVPREETSVPSIPFDSEQIYDELGWFMKELRLTWGIPRLAAEKMFADLTERYSYFALSDRHKPLSSHYDVGSIVACERRTFHVLLVVHGIFPGGAENFPIQLANSLVARGWNVSMLIFKTDDINPYMRRSLNPAVSVYESEWVAEYGCDRFLREAGVSVIHSHGMVGEVHFFERWKMKERVPYVATLHGSYEASNKAELPDTMLARFAARVDHFVYTADKNLGPLAPYEIEPARLTKMINAMPIDPVEFPLSRKEMGIAEDAVVFTFVARGIKEKGWSNAISAFRKAREISVDRPLHLCLVGEGEEPDRLKKIHGRDPAISFMGYQSRIYGLYRLSDVAIVPSRFSGESYPLCIIQALQVAVPVIASDIGEIASMISRDGEVGGIVIPASKSDRKFTSDLAQAMCTILDDDVRQKLAAGAGALGKRYDMEALVDEYIGLYRGLIAMGARRRPARPRPLRNDRRTSDTSGGRRRAPASIEPGR